MTEKLKKFIAGNYLALEAVLIVAIVVAAYVSNSGGSSAARISNAMVPLGLSETTHRPANASAYRFLYDDVKYVAVYEKATGYYYVYDGGACLGYLHLEHGEDIQDLSGHEIMMNMGECPKMK